MATFASPTLSTFRLKASECILAFDWIGVLTIEQAALFRESLLKRLITCHKAWNELTLKQLMPGILASMFCELDKAQSAISNNASSKEKRNIILKNFDIGRISENDSRIKHSKYRLCSLEAFKLDNTAETWWNEFFIVNEPKCSAAHQSDSDDTAAVPANHKKSSDIDVKRNSLLGSRQQMGTPKLRPVVEIRTTASEKQTKRSLDNDTFLPKAKRSRYTSSNSSQPDVNSPSQCGPKTSLEDRKDATRGQVWRMERAVREMTEYVRNFRRSHST